MIDNKSLRVLIADDEDSTAVVIQRLLTNMGHEIIGRAANGREAVELTRSLKPEIILMDIGMPEMDGLEATGIIQRDCPTPVVLLTAYDDQKMVLRASHTGAGAYLLKPPSANEIERTMIIALSRFEDLMELKRLNTELKAALEKVKQLMPWKDILKHILKYIFPTASARNASRSCTPNLNLLKRNAAVNSCFVLQTKFKSREFSNGNVTTNPFVLMKTKDFISGGTVWLFCPI